MERTTDKSYGLAKTEWVTLSMVQNVAVQTEYSTDSFSRRSSEALSYKSTVNRHIFLA